MSEDRKAEGLHALGKKTQYKMDYAPEVLETFVNKHQDNDYWCVSTAPSSRHSVPSPANPISQRYASATFPTYAWWKVRA